MKYDEMTDEELRALSQKRKKSDGCYTYAARRAQEELYYRAHSLDRDFFRFYGDAGPASAGSATVTRRFTNI